MINIFIYYNDKFKNKAIKATDGKVITLEDNENILDVFNLIVHKAADNNENNYIVNDIAVLEVLSNLTTDYDRVGIYLNSRFIYGGKWCKFRKQDKEDFIKSIKHTIKTIKNYERKKEC